MAKMANFFDLKKRVKIKDLLDHYDISYGDGKGNELVAYCPFCNSGGFKANKEKNAWICFSDEECGKGNILDFVMKMEGCGLKKAGLLLEEWFPETEKKPEAEIPIVAQIREDEKKEYPHNPAIKIALDLDPARTPFKEETAKHFDAGYCKRGIHKGKVAIPIFDLKGRLVAYAGISDEGISLPKNYLPNVDVYNLVHTTKPIIRLVSTIYEVWDDYEHGIQSVCVFAPLDKYHIYRMKRWGVRALSVNAPITENELAKLARYFFVRLPSE